MPFAYKIDGPTTCSPGGSRSALMARIPADETKSGTCIFAHRTGALQHLNMRTTIGSKQYAARLQVGFRRFGEPPYLPRNLIGQRHKAGAGKEDHRAESPHAGQAASRFGLRSSTRLARWWSSVIDRHLWPFPPLAQSRATSQARLAAAAALETGNGMK